MTTSEAAFQLVMMWEKAERERQSHMDRWHATNAGKNAKELARHLADHHTEQMRALDVALFAILPLEA